MTATQTATGLESLLLDPSGPKVVAIGGGHGLAVTLQAVQNYAAEVTAVVGVADDGGSSGRLTEGLGLPSPGDVRRCLLALTPEPSIFSEVFGYRFKAGDIEDHALGNLLLAALTDLLGDFAVAVDAAAALLGAIGRVVPAATEPARLSAVVGGRVVEGQVAIMKSRGGVESLDVGPEGIAANPAAVAAIAGADQIVLGPGSLFTSLLAVLMLPGMADAVRASRASRVFVLNLVTKDGETFGLDGAAHLEKLYAMAGFGGPGAVVVHRGPLEVPEGVEEVTVGFEQAARWGWALVEADIADPSAGWPAHDPVKLGWVLSELVAGR
jgi:uncharacterized cofD-like protein